MVKRNTSLEKGKPMATTRKIIQIGNSFGITIPKEWLDQHHLVKGDMVPIVANNILKVVPISEIS